MNIVPRVQTPLGTLEMAAILRDAHHAVFQADISANRLATAWAQCALEHGRGQYIYCHNIGNVTAFGWDGDAYEVRFTRKQNPDDAPPGPAPEFVMHFRAHDDFVDGARDYWHVLAGRYASVLPIFDQGLPSSAAERLKELGYYTANEATYAAGMSGLFHEYMTRVLPSL